MGGLCNQSNVTQLYNVGSCPDDVNAHGDINDHTNPSCSDLVALNNVWSNAIKAIQLLVSTDTKMAGLHAMPEHMKYTDILLTLPGIMNVAILYNARHA